MVRYKTTKTNHSLNKKNKKKGKKTFKVQNNLCTGAQKNEIKKLKNKQTKLNIKINKNTTVT